MRVLRALLPAAPLLLVALPAQALEFELLDQGLLGDDFAELVNTQQSYAADFIELTGDGMLDQAFALQHTSTNGSATLGGARGIHAGLQLVTFPFSQIKNLVGKTENTSFSPVLPRVQAGYVSGKQGSDGGKNKLQWGATLSLVPPLKVGGASAFVVGVDASAGYEVHPSIRLGAELSFSTGSALAPVTATREQYEAGTLTNLSAEAQERYETVCDTNEFAPGQFGCLDTLTLSHTGLNLVGVYRVSDAVEPFVRLGAQYVSDTFYVDVDMSRYLLSGILPTASLGSTLNFSQKLRATVGVQAGFAPALANGEGVDVLWRAELGASYMF